MFKLAIVLLIRALLPGCIGETNQQSSMLYSETVVKESPGKGVQPIYLQGFTLVEVMAMVVILALLVSVSLPALVRANQKSVNASCVSNLRQIGYALQTYAEANLDRLPGPLFALPAASYNATSRQELIWFLADHLGYPKPPADRAPAPILVCPAYSKHGERLKHGDPDSTYVLNGNVSQHKGSPVPPFGNPGTPGVETLKLSTLSNYAPPAAIFAIRDADKGNVDPTVARWGDLPYRPVHGKFRNQLFFDWHVEEKCW